MSWTSAKLKLAAQSRKAIITIKRYQLPFDQFSHTNMFQLFKSIVVPILTYVAEILGHTYSKDIGKVQTEFCRYYLGVNSLTTVSYIYFTKCIKYWCKLLQMSDTRYPKSCNKMLMLHDNIGRTNWVTVLQFIRYTQHMYTYDMRRNKHNIHTYYRTRLFWSKNNNDKENKYQIFTISIRLWVCMDKSRRWTHKHVCFSL